MSGLMLCRRCGMESSTTDQCEWCKRPMLPTGATITDQQTPDAKTAEQIAEGRAAAEGVKPLGEQAAAEEEQPKAGAREEESVLRPLGSAPATPRTGGVGPPPVMPSHGITDEQTKTSVDVSQYTAGEQSIFRPIERPERADAMGGADPLARRRRRRETRVESEIPENIRLLRSVIAGVIISLVLALIQFTVSRMSEGAKEVPGSLIFASVTLIKNLGQSGTLVSALMYGTLMGVLMGLGLGAVLVRFRRGPFVGMLVGLVVGYGLMNYPWGLILGALAGIAIGIIASVGLRQVVAV